MELKNPGIPEIWNSGCFELEHDWMVEVQNLDSFVKSGIWAVLHRGSPDIWYIKFIKFPNSGIPTITEVSKSAALDVGMSSCWES